MLVLIDYGLIVVFFVVLFVLALIITHQPSEAQKSIAAHTNSGLQQNKLSYGFLAVLFVLLLVVTLLPERKQIT